MMRLQKYMALCGVASRRHCENMIRQGLVQVNGVTVTEMGTVVTEGDIVAVRGETIRPEEEKVYIMYHKPMGEVTTVSDEKGRDTVMDHFKDLPVRVYPVGRLDYNSEGLLLLTNDGALAEALTHPKNQISKQYLARITGHLTQDQLRSLKTGVILDDGFKTAPADVRVIREDPFATSMLITIRQGHNRQVRKMIESQGSKVLLLRRIRLGTLDLKGLERGAWRNLTAEEVDQLKKAALSHPASRAFTSNKKT